MPIPKNNELGNMAALYGKLFLAQAQFEKDIQDCLLERLVAAKERMAACGLELDDRSVIRDIYKLPWGRFVYARRSLVKCGSIELVGSPSFDVGFCWLRNPVSEQTALPYADVAFQYSRRANADVWKVQMKRVAAEISKEVCPTIMIGETHFAFASEEYYRANIDELLADLDRLIECVAVAVSKAGI